MKYELHPLCALFPRLEGEDFDALCRDIEASGLRQPIVLQEGTILDGGNRYRACKRVGVEPHFVQHDGSNLVSFVLGANLNRRHLTAGQRAALVAAATDWAKAHKVGAPANSATVAPLATVADRMERSGASARTQKRADRVAKEDPELAKQVISGEVSLPAAVEKVRSEKAKPETPNTPTKAEREKTRIEKLEARIVELERDNEELVERNAELARQAEGTLDDNESMARVFESNEQITSALAEAKRYREMNRILEVRICGLQNERNAAIGSARGYKTRLEKLEKAERAH